MTHYLARVSFQYSKTLNHCDKIILLDSETFSDLRFGCDYAFLLHGIEDEYKCKCAIDHGIKLACQEFREIGILKNGYRVFSPQDAEKECGKYNIGFSTDYPVSEKLFHGFVQVYYEVESQPERLLRRVKERKGEKCVAFSNYRQWMEVTSEENRCYFISNSKQWKDEKGNTIVLYPPPKDRATLNGIRDCILRNLIRGGMELSKYVLSWEGSNGIAKEPLPPVKVIELKEMVNTNTLTESELKELGKPKGRERWCYEYWEKTHATDEQIAYEYKRLTGLGVAPESVGRAIRRAYKKRYGTPMPHRNKNRSKQSKAA